MGRLHTFLLSRQLIRCYNRSIARCSTLLTVSIGSMQMHTSILSKVHVRRRCVVLVLGKLDHICLCSSLVNQSRLSFRCARKFVCFQTERRGVHVFTFELASPLKRRFSAHRHASKRLCSLRQNAPIAKYCSDVLKRLVLSPNTIALTDHPHIFWLPTLQISMKANPGALDPTA